MELEVLIKVLMNNGLAGIMLGFFIWYINKRDREHATERSEWKKSLDDHNDRLLNVLEKNVEALTSMEEAVKNMK